MYSMHYSTLEIKKGTRGVTAHLPVIPLFMAETAMQNILLMYEDGSFKVVNVQVYERMLYENQRADVEISRGFLSNFMDKKYCVRIPSQSAAYWRNLSEFSAEMRSLLVLYEI